MEASPPESLMSQRIFTLSLPTDMVSLYLLCCGLADIGIPVTETALMDRWNGTAEELQAGLHSLEIKGIVKKDAGTGEAAQTWSVNPPSDWTPAA